MMRHIVNEIKYRLLSSDVDRLIHALGGRKKEDGQDFNIYSTICHNHDGEGSYKLYYYKKTKMFFCYTNCNSMSVIDLVQHALDLDFKQSVSYLANFLNIGNSLAPVGFGNNTYHETNNSKQEVEVEVTLPVLDKNVLDIFLDYHCCEWLQEGISSTTMSKYSIKYFLEQHKIVIPHFNINDELVGIRGRALLQEDLDKRQKYMPIFIGNKWYSHSLMHNLYGLNFNKEAIERTKKAIIFEGEKSVLLMDTYYGKSNCSVAVCGSRIHKTHIKLLLELGVEEIVIAFDKEYTNTDEKEIYKNKIYKNIEKLNLNCNVSIIFDEIENGLIGYKSAPVDNGKKVFEQLLQKRNFVVKKERHVHDIVCCDKSDI